VFDDHVVFPGDLAARPVFENFDPSVTFENWKVRGKQDIPVLLDSCVGTIFMVVI
jgi:hypothetical protein